MENIIKTNNVRKAEALIEAALSVLSGLESCNTTYAEVQITVDVDGIMIDHKSFPCKNPAPYFGKDDKRP
jgi:hypothetical protein